MTEEFSLILPAQEELQRINFDGLSDIADNI